MHYHTPKVYLVTSVKSSWPWEQPTHPCGPSDSHGFSIRSSPVLFPPVLMRTGCTSGSEKPGNACVWRELRDMGQLSTSGWPRGEWWEMRLVSVNWGTEKADHREWRMNESAKRGKQRWETKMTARLDFQSISMFQFHLDPEAWLLSWRTSWS